MNLIHFNVRSLPKNKSKIICFLEQLRKEHSPVVIAISEINTSNIKFIDIKNY